jgi:effector-binding domain-containing protein
VETKNGRVKVRVKFGLIPAEYLKFARPCESSYEFIACEGHVSSSSTTPIATHAGPHAGIDRAYGALAPYVADHALSIEGPIREIYLVDGHTTADSSQWRTQIGWPIFRTAE